MEDEIAKLKMELDTTKEKLEEITTSKSARIKELESLLVETASATQREAEAIRLTEQEMHSAVESKEQEAREHKRLRQQAKKEALSLAKQLEGLQETLMMLTQRVDSVVFPRMREVSSSARNIEWQLDAALSANEAQDSRGRIQSFGNSGRISSFSRESSGEGLDSIIDDDENRSVENQGEDLGGENSEAEDADVSRRASVSSIGAKSRQKSEFELSAQRVDRLAHQLSVLLGALSRIQEKSRELCDLALFEETAWSIMAKSLRRSVEDCFLRRTTPVNAPQVTTAPRRTSGTARYELAPVSD